MKTTKVKTKVYRVLYMMMSKNKQILRHTDITTYIDESEFDLTFGLERKISDRYNFKNIVEVLKIKRIA